MHKWIGFCQRGRVSVDMDLDQLVNAGRVVKWVFSREHLIHDRSERIQVGALVFRLALTMLGTHVRRASPEFARLSQSAVCVIEFCQSEINHFYEIRFIIHQNDVAWLQIAVNNTLAMRMVECAANLHSNSQKSVDWQWTFLTNQHFQTSTTQVIHDYVGLIVRSNNAIVDSDDVWMAQRAQQINFVLESFAIDWLRIELHPQCFDSDVAINSQLICFVDHAHATRAEHFLNLKSLVENCPDERVHPLSALTGL